MSRSSVKDVDRGAMAALRRMSSGPIRVRAGVPEESRRSDGTLNATVAVAQELGLGTSPQPWLRPWADDAGERRGLRATVSEQLRSHIRGRLDRGGVASAVGMKMAEGLRSRVPVDTGELRDAIGFEVDR